MPTFAEFFAGIGLVRMGLERHGWQVVFANDYSAQKLEMYRSQFPDAERHFILDNISNIEATQIPAITMATASFPCNDLSLAGSRAGLNGDHSGTFWRFIELMNAMGERRPPILLIENVVGFLNSHEGHDFETALIALNDLGYSVDSIVIDAIHFVPQSRPRMFVVGTLNTPAHLHESIQITDTRPKDLVKFILKHPEIQWNIRDLPPLPQRENALDSIIEDLPDNAPEWWGTERAEYLLNQMSPRHRATADHLINRNTWSYGTVFRRMRNNVSTAELRVDGVAGCLRTPRGGSAKQILFKAGYGRYSARLLTPTECARLMGADNYNITVPRDQALFGFGDAVCVHAIEWIAQSYLAILLNELTPDMEIPNHSASTADAPTERSGDFVIGDTVFHVTMAPQDLVFLKCKRNLVDNCRVYLLVPEKRISQAVRNAKIHELEDDIVIKSIESFVGQNIDELGRFSTELLVQEIRKLIAVYNRRIQVERYAPEIQIEELNL